MERDKSDSLPGSVGGFFLSFFPPSPVAVRSRLSDCWPFLSKIMVQLVWECLSVPAPVAPPV